MKKQMKRFLAGAVSLMMAMSSPLTVWTEAVSDPGFTGQESALEAGEGEMEAAQEHIFSPALTSAQMEEEEDGAEIPGLIDTPEQEAAGFIGRYPAQR